MKILFTILLGVSLGWLAGLVDAPGQLALEQHQKRMHLRNTFQTATDPPMDSPKFPTSFRIPFFR